MPSTLISQSVWNTTRKRHMENRIEKVAIVTGGARGIGRGSALALADRGFDIALVDLLHEEAEATANEIRARGVAAETFEADVADFARAQDVTDAIISKWGRVDFLLNNAGRAMPKGLLEISEAEWDRTIDINLKGCFNWCRAVTPAMQHAGAGRIVSISSVNAYTGGVTSAVSKFAYAAAKAGILGLTRSLAKELAPDITVNAICPGVIETEATSGMIGARRDELVAGIALERLGTPEDVGTLVAFMATVEPNFITGQAITVDGFQWVI